MSIKMITLMVYCIDDRRYIYIHLVEFFAKFFLFLCFSVVRLFQVLFEKIYLWKKNWLSISDDNYEGIIVGNRGALFYYYQ